MLDYLRYFGTHVLILATAAGLIAGGAWCWSGLALGVLVWIAGDALSGPIAERPHAYRHPRVLDVALYSLFPSLIVLCLAFAWALATDDLFGIGATMNHWVTRDILNARAAAGIGDYVGASLSFGLAIALGGILTAHELGHRTDDPVAMWVARWMLALAFNASLEVAHVFGHHRDVGTPADPATARRGENIYHFFIRSTFGQILQAWRIEQARLGHPADIAALLRHKVLRGLVRSWLVAAAFFAAGGAAALVAFLLASTWNKFLLESLNYLEHYGLVRVAGTPIEPRHAWDSRSRFSHAALFNLPWHADHHKRPGIHYPDLRPSPGAPLLAVGYLATLPVVWVPPLWRRLIAPRLAAWDREHASAEERTLLRSGV